MFLLLLGSDADQREWAVEWGQHEAAGVSRHVLPLHQQGDRRARNPQGVRRQLHELRALQPTRGY